jgi:hypothetical protein
MGQVFLDAGPGDGADQYGKSRPEGVRRSVGVGGFLGRACLRVMRCWIMLPSSGE